ncbi:MAG: hypothetical protein ACI88H_003632 [Cocleimonas sp.]|jgi:hypothetical protein
MNSQQRNHTQDRVSAKQKLSAAGLTTNQEDTYHWIEKALYKDIYHFVLYLGHSEPIKLKLAHAEDNTNNQSDKCSSHLRKLSRHGEPVLFVLCGQGWRSPSLKKHIPDFKEIIGESYVIHISDLVEWVKSQIEKLESH